MCSYVFCDDMNEAYMRFASLSAWPYVAVIMGVWLVLLSEKPSCTSRVEWFENHIYELRSEELNEGWSSQLYTQLLQLRKERTKKKGPEFSSGFLFATAKVAYKTAMIILHFNYKQDCRTTNKEAVFKLFNFYSYIIFGVGGRGVVKIIKRSKRGLN